MNKYHCKEKWKTAITKIRAQWQDYNDDDFSKLQANIENKELKKYKQLRHAHSQARYFKD